jgi:hypothetical protein
MTIGTNNSLAAITIELVKDVQAVTADRAGWKSRDML